ncbi:MAG: putative quinol monooxygenase [Aquabacterium sp.]
MIIVLGSVRIAATAVDAALALAQVHVARSRSEPGCLEHGVHRDAEDPGRLVFVERWADRVALDAHFRVPASRAFVREIAALAVAPPQMALYDADALPGPL